MALCRHIKNADDLVHCMYLYTVQPNYQGLATTEILIEDSHFMFTFFIKLQK